MARQYCWWLVAKDEQGKTILVFGSDKGEDEARQHGLEMLSGVDFEIKRLPTKNLARASSLLKGETLRRTSDLRQATKRLRHKIGRRPE